MLQIFSGVFKRFHRMPNKVACLEAGHPFAKPFQTPRAVIWDPEERKEVTQAMS